ncbi:MAG: hypothetical protein ACOY31_06870 [Bacillota bacterium]
MALLFNNYIVLFLAGLFCNLYRSALSVAVIFAVFLTLNFIAGPQFFLLVVVVLSLYLAALAAYIRFWRLKSARLGLRLFIVVPGSRFWFEKLSRRRGLDLEITRQSLELHVNTGAVFSDWGDYNLAMEEDIRIIRGLRENRSMTFNSFNHRVADRLERAFPLCIRIRGVALAAGSRLVYSRWRFERIQKKMFGRVISKRDVQQEDGWDLLVIN